MKSLKISSILLLSLFILCAFTPEVSARHHRSRSSFGLNFNIGGPSYAVAPAPVAVYRSYAPAPVYACPYPCYYAPAPVYVERPSVYVQPSFSYSYWR